jgi:hypothetical protein
VEYAHCQLAPQILAEILHLARLSPTVVDQEVEALAVLPLLWVVQGVVVAVTLREGEDYIPKDLTESNRLALLAEVVLVVLVLVEMVDQAERL